MFPSRDLGPPAELGIEDDDGRPTGELGLFFLTADFFFVVFAIFFAAPADFFFAVFTFFVTDAPY
jgi:hypothetical protein